VPSNKVIKSHAAASKQLLPQTTQLMGYDGACGGQCKGRRELHDI
jgi:hypothetical protein